MKVEKICQTCGVKYWVIPSLAKISRFCSRSCLGVENAKRCNANRKPCVSNPSWFKKGQLTGVNSPDWIEPAKFCCKYCGGEFFRKPWQIRQGLTKFCSFQCSVKFKQANLSGENAPDYVGGEKTYRGRNWKKIRLQVVEEQGGRCLDCGVFKGKSLPVHHKRPFRKFSNWEEANTRDNLEGLCQSCHMKHEYQERRIQSGIQTELCIG